MRVRVLGAAAGGGFPQWNCGCDNCSRLRLSVFNGTARSQIQVAVSTDDSRWFLLGASPDLKQQIDACPALQARAGARNSPIQGAVLTCAEIDQVLGLLLLREFQPLAVYSTASVRAILRETNAMFAALERIADQVRWIDVRLGNAFPLRTLDGEASGILCEPMLGHGGFPGFVPEPFRSRLREDEAAIGLTLTSPSDKTLKYLPGALLDDPKLTASLEDCDVLLLDGTFWDDEELIRAGVSGRTARVMRHSPISGAGGSLELLAGLKRPRRIFIHINNTNPILDESSEAYGRVRSAGWEVAYDGMEICL